VPHNFLLFDRLPAAEVDRIVNAMLNDPQAPGRGWIPESRSVLVATPLVDPHGSHTITVSVPKTPGDYPFVCTFPGHVATMRGILRVQP
jgi:azurin